MVAVVVVMVNGPNALAINWWHGSLPNTEAIECSDGCILGGSEPPAAAAAAATAVA